MILDPEQKANLQSLADGAKCPVCGSNHFIVNDEIVTVPLVGDENPDGTHPTRMVSTKFLLGAAYCEKCGYTHFFKL